MLHPIWRLTATELAGKLTHLRPFWKNTCVYLAHPTINLRDLCPLSQAKDDAGLAIANSMTSQITGMNHGIRNSNDGISLSQPTAGPFCGETRYACA